MMNKSATIRSGGKQITFDHYTRGLAIKHFCRDCMNGVASEVKNCTAPECPLYPFRPYQKKSSSSKDPSQKIQ
jgi:hypothetical protein